MRLRKLLKFFLPYGAVELFRNRKTMANLGRRLRPREWFESDWLVHEAETAGLNLFPPGFAGQIKHVVDVGANVGQWSGMVLDCLDIETLTIIEPGPAAFAELQKRFGSDARITLHNVAIGAEEGIGRLKVTRDPTGASLLQPREEMKTLVGGNWTVTSEVEARVTMLDQLLKDRKEISLLKIDVQGAEKAVLAGAKATLGKTKFLLVELNYMPQYEGGSWLGELHEILVHEYGFFLANASRPLCLNGRASMCDGLYVNPAMVPQWVKPDFV
jgi:FkbM family methyltransferase